MSETEVEKEVVEPTEPLVKNCPLYCHWTDEETEKFNSITRKWVGGTDWGFIFDVETLPSWVYELTFEQFMENLTKDKDEKSMKEVLTKYTGCDYLV